jgi:hypothetical protein
VQNASVQTARLHRLNFDVVPRVLISKVLAVSQGINKASMV